MTKEKLNWRGCMNFKSSIRTVPPPEHTHSHTHHPGIDHPRPLSHTTSQKNSIMSGTDTDLLHIRNDAADDKCTGGYYGNKSFLLNTECIVHVDTHTHTHQCFFQFACQAPL